jgi:hypothetical protein
MTRFLRLGITIKKLKPNLKKKIERTIYSFGLNDEIEKNNTKGKTITIKRIRNKFKEKNEMIT